jgi:flagellar basal-body rod protein FlgG
VTEASQRAVPAAPTVYGPETEVEVATPRRHPEAADIVAAVPRHAAVTKSMLTALDTRIQVILDNLANVNTLGFKRSVVQFASLPPKTLVSPGRLEDAGGTSAPMRSQVGRGTQVLTTTKIYSPGTLDFTERSLDLAIDGKGFFQVRLPDGNTGYTRAGHFLINADGSIVNSVGHILEPQITIPPDVLHLNVNPQGQVTGTTAGSPDTTSFFGRIRLTRFMNPAGLLSIGTNIVRQTSASGAPTVDSVPGSNGLGTLLQGCLERSNVDMSRELIDLFEARRQYDTVLQAFATASSPIK